jgi:hypothetical protein
MTCDEIQLCLERKLAGVLSVEEGRALQQHTDGCSACSSYVRQAEAAQRALLEVGEEPPSSQRLDALDRALKGADRPLIKDRGDWGLLAANMVGLALNVTLVWLSGYAHFTAMVTASVVVVGGAALLHFRRERQELAKLIELATSAEDLLFAHRADLARRTKEFHQATTAEFVVSGIVLVMFVVQSLSALRLPRPGVGYWVASLLVLAATSGGSALYQRLRIEPRLRREFEDLREVAS